MDVEDLALAQQLAPDRGGDLARRRSRRRSVSTGCRSSGGVVIVDISRMPVIAISSVRGIGVADMRQHVDVGAQVLELLLVLDAEALLLVDDDEAEVLEPDLGG